MRRYGIDSTLLVANQIEALLAIGEWDEADSAQRRRAPRHHRQLPAHAASSSAPTLEIGRGDFDAARAHLDAARATLREDRGLGDLRRLPRRARPLGAPLDGRRRGRATTGWRGRAPREAAQIRVQLCAKGLRAQAELAALARARRDADAVRDRLGRARKLLAAARRAAAEASAVTPERRRLARAGRGRVRARPRRARGPSSWSEAAAAWERLERPPARGVLPLAPGRGARRRRRVPRRGERAAQGGARRRGADRSASRCCASSSCSPQRARLDLAPPDAGAARRDAGPEETLGLTPREAEVLTLVARGYTNREIAATLVISVKTASVHVSHILRKLDAPNRLEAAAIAHRVAPPPTARRFQASTAPRGLPQR